MAGWRQIESCGGGSGWVAVDLAGEELVVVDLAGEELVVAALDGGEGSGGGGGGRGGWLFESLPRCFAFMQRPVESCDCLSAYLMPPCMLG
jgi:hypothetical protein